MDVENFPHSRRWRPALTGKLYLPGGVACCGRAAAVQTGAHLPDLHHSCSLRRHLSGLRLSGNGPGTERRGERHAADLHRPLRLLPQTVLGSLVPAGPLDPRPAHPGGSHRHGNQSDHDLPQPPGLFSRGRLVLLWGGSCLCHTTTSMSMTRPLDARLTCLCLFIS
ncbi:uncharacterized protein LOC133537796 isoform X1 [Nerophis ophidion]|uniref:uncharacterized protein LOC133537796 isoform X1 n=1 Tax=Nerophis ophidion TaxID=159077 RepID=UPI002AE0948D|nr:uncharacterized protein LOC133537796 isoform X1 [Nerophis ophidion]